MYKKSFKTPSFKNKKLIPSENINEGELITKVDYKSIEIPITIRHYINISPDSKLYINGSLLLDINTNSHIYFERVDGSNLSTLDIKPFANFALGFGYSFKNVFSLEIRAHSNRNTLGSYTFWNSDYKNNSLILGYTLF